MALSPFDFQLKMRGGKRFVYYTGFMVFDREKNVPADNVARCAWSFMLDGKVVLTQRKIGPQKYEYIAMPTKEINPPVFTGCYDPEWLAQPMKDVRRKNSRGFNFDYKSRSAAIERILANGPSA